MSGTKLLVVEDDKTTASIMQLKLRSYGYDVASMASNSEEALQQVAAFKPKLVLMDIHLGNGKDGIETAKIIRERFETPVVFVTSFSDKKTLQRATHTMPLGYINKPLRDNDLKTTIALALQKIKASEGESLTTHIRHISHTHSNETAFRQALNYLSIGVLLVDKKLEPSFINQAANQFIKNENNIEIDNGVITLATEELDLKLMELVSSNKGGVLSIRQHIKNSSTELLVSPIDSNDQDSNSTKPSAIVFVFHAQKNNERFEELLKALYHFTNAEARLASALVRDPRLEQAAESIGIKMNTARSHLKRIFNKTGTDRQSSLINLIVSGPAGLIIKTNGK